MVHAPKVRSEGYQPRFAVGAGQVNGGRGRCPENTRRVRIITCDSFSDGATGTWRRCRRKKTHHVPGVDVEVLAELLAVLHKVVRVVARDCALPVLVRRRPRPDHGGGG